MSHDTTETAPTPEGQITSTASPHGPYPAFTGRRNMGIVLVLTGAVGWIASGILILEKLELYRNPGHVTSCDINPWVSCGQVMETWQSELFGFPNPFIGLVGFTIIITTGMALFAGARFGRWYWAGLQAGVTLATVFAVWLWSQALFEIYILCLYCMIVWAAMIPLFILTTIRNMVHGVIPTSARVAQWVSAWVGPIIAFTYVVVAASVFIRFFHVFTN